MNLRCFRCRAKFKKREDIFRNKSGYPLCEDCFHDEIIDNDWDDDCGEDIIKEIREKFHGNYNKFLKDFHEKNDKCDGCSRKYYDIMYYPKKDLVEIEGKKLCSSCIDTIIDKEREVMNKQ